VKDTEAHEQHKNIIVALKAAAPEWEFVQINFDHGLVFESDFYNKLKKLDIQEGKKDKLFADHVTQVCKAHNPAGARRYKANYRGIAGEYWAQCARVRR